jgi:beta-aspartyl-dipeptidase (metallo-type)
VLTLIENAELYAPDYRGRVSLLFAESILKVGRIDRRALDALGLRYESIDAGGRYVVPGLIDPHEHLCGGSGNGGFSTETPPIYFREIVTAGITTVVGTLGTDTTTTNHRALLARVKGLREMGLSAYMYTGGYNVPPSTITGSIRDDIMLLDEIVGAGEVAIADARSTDPNPHELAKLINDAYVGGMLANKAGVTHFHVGDQPKGMSMLRTVLDEYDALPQSIYPTHIERNEKLMREAIELVRRGCTADIDVVEKDLTKWLPFYLDHGGDPDRLTISSDSFMTGPHNLFEQVRECIRECGLGIDRVLPFVTKNTARVLKLPRKGAVAETMDADLLVLEPGSLDLVDVFAWGRWLVRGGGLANSSRNRTGIFTWLGSVIGD